MGERSIRISHGILGLILLVFMNGGVRFLINFITNNRFLLNPSQSPEVQYNQGLDSAVWVAFYISYIALLYIRRGEAIKSRTSSESARFSYSDGDSLVVAWLKSKNINLSVRSIEIYIEPLLFISIGLLLHFIGSTLGIPIIVCGLFYSYSFMYAYQIGDDFVLDKMDEMIVNKNLKEVFCSEDSDLTINGFRYRGIKPFSPEEREEISNNLFSDEDDPNAESR